VELLIDTSSNFLIIGLFSNYEKIDLLFKDNNRNHTENTISEVEKLLSKNNIYKNSIKEIYICIGPGSYVGSRIPIIIANAWKIFNKKINIYCINSIFINLPKDHYSSIIAIPINKRELIKAEIKDLKIIYTEIINKNEFNKSWIFGYKNIDFDLKWLRKLSQKNLKLEPIYFRKSDGEIIKEWYI